MIIPENLPKILNLVLALVLSVGTNNDLESYIEIGGFGLLMKKVVDL